MSDASSGSRRKRTVVEHQAPAALEPRPGLQVQVVAEALDIHPFMLSRWRKEFREGHLRSSRRAPKPRASKAPLVRELRRLQALEDAHRVLQEEHALLKKAIRFSSARRRTSSRYDRHRGTLADDGQAVVSCDARRLLRVVLGARPVRVSGKTES